MLPPGSPWTCPSDHLFYDASVIWGLIGPERIFGDLGYYSAMNWGFLLGAIAPVIVWLMHKAFPGRQWIILISVPVILAVTIEMPPATAVNFNSWIVIAFLSGFVAYRYHREWWRRALDAGLAFMGIFIYLGLDISPVHFDWWGSKVDGCPLASCPTEPGVVVEGCPVYLASHHQIHYP